MGTSHLPAVPPAPTVAGLSDAPPAAVRARLWLSGRVFGPADDGARLWLILADGRVLAFRLPQGALGDDTLLAPLAAAVADDVRGQRWELEHLAFGQAQLLYAAPVLPIACAGHAGFIFDSDYRRYAAALDGEIVRLLLDLEREPHPAAVTRADGESPHPLPKPYLASVRNYNRLVTLPPTIRLHRLQALRRFPLLVAPCLLTLHHSPNVWSGKRHAWREKDPAVEAAIDAGRDLVGALARRYGISKGLVRSPLCAQMWPVRDAAIRMSWLKLLDALPANQRPSLVEFERWQLYLANYFALLGEDDHGHPLPQPPHVHRGAFRLGWTRTWETAARRHGDLHPALADCRDFLQAARERAAAITGRPCGPAVGRLAAAWLALYGLLGLLAASARWHRQRRVLDPWPVPDGFRLPAILGRLADRGRHARELLTPQELMQEGEAMRHCVANYWPDCLAGDRIFALRLANGERATAQYHPTLRDDADYDARYRLVQLRGPCNERVSQTMSDWAEAVAVELNVPGRASGRRAALEVRGLLESQHLAVQRPAVHLDEASERQLRRALDWLHLAPLPPQTLLFAHIAGYQHHAGPRLEEELASGQPLALVREPDNPHDRLAVRIEWNGEKLGYVPRAHNAEIARRLDAGERLVARIAEIDPPSEPWRRVAFVIDQATMPAPGLR